MELMSEKLRFFFFFLNLYIFLSFVFINYETTKTLTHVCLFVVELASLLSVSILVTLVMRLLRERS